MLFSFVSTSLTIVQVPWRHFEVVLRSLVFTDFFKVGLGCFKSFSLCWVNHVLQVAVGCQGSLFFVALRFLNSVRFFEVVFSSVCVDFSSFQFVSDCVKWIYMFSAVVGCLCDLHISSLFFAKRFWSCFLGGIVFWCFFMVWDSFGLCESVPVFCF